MYRRAAAYLRDHGIDPTRADDALSTVMARILARNPTTPDPDDWEAYLMTAVLNAARDEVGTAANRRERPDPLDVGRADDTDDGRGDDPCQPRRGRGRSPDPVGDLVAHAIDQERQLAEVHRIVDTLPPDQQTVIRQVLLGGRTGREVAEELGVNESRVSQLKKAGVMALKTALIGVTP